jgi:ferredoxin
MAKSKESIYRLSSLKMEKPGLLALLFKRSPRRSITSFLFHLGVWCNIITGLIMEVVFLTIGVSDVFSGWGWLLSWAHGITGFLIIVGGIGIITQYIRNPAFRLAYGKVFFLDLAFLAAFAIVGLVQFFPVFGFISIVGFTPTSIKWLGTLHMIIIYVWIVVSLIAGGAIRHAVATIAWRVIKPESRPTGLMVFADACGKCGRCIEVCPTFKAFNNSPIEAPIIKLRKYYQMHRSKRFTPSEIRLLSEQLATCAQCNLCAGVCPFSFNYAALYQEMLRNAQQLALAKTI